MFNPRNDFERCFSSVLLGGRQATIAHMYHVGDSIYHVCIIDSCDYYDEGWYHVERSTFTITRLPSRP